jgi:hypothetical protein
MAGESQRVPEKEPDPSTLTTDQMLLKVGDTKELIEAQFDVIRARLDGIDKATIVLHDDFVRFPTEVQKEVGHLRELYDIRMEAEREITAIREAYRIELKNDSKEALTTALTAAEKAVQAALAAAEKARDQQTIASQLATDKAEKSFVEALSQLNNTFTVAIAGVVAGVNEAKSGIADIRSEQRGGQLNVSSVQADKRVTGMWIGLAVTLIFGFLGFIVGGISLILAFVNR